MKNIFNTVLFVLLICGVFGADEDKVKSVMEGDSVTLNPDLTQIQTVILILWRFKDKGPVIAQISDKKISYPNQTEISRDRLQLDQNGSLTIKNMRTKHSGLYELQISHSDGTSYRNLNVIVYESPPVIAGAEAEMKSMSVTEGDPVTLHIPQIQGDELIVWRFGDEEKLIAKADLEAKSTQLNNETYERFRDRLKLDIKTGSLIITNTRTTDSGLYKVKISSNKQTSYKRFTITVNTGVSPGLSPGAVAVIVVGVLLVAAAAAGVMYYFRPRTSNLPNKTWSVPPGDNVTLKPDTTIQTADEIQWLFGDEDTLIAENKGETREMTTNRGPDMIFMNRLKLDKTTGSLTITNTRTEHTGLYTLKIRRGRETLYKRFSVSVRERIISVMNGDPFTLKSATEIQTDDEIQWLFRDEEQETLIAEIKTTEVTTYDRTDEIFRNRLELKKETGSLTITEFTAAHAGYYTLKIRRGSETLYDRIFVYENFTGKRENKEEYVDVNEVNEMLLNKEEYVDVNEVNEMLLNKEEYVDVNEVNEMLLNKEEYVDVNEVNEMLLNKEEYVDVVNEQEGTSSL